MDAEFGSRFTAHSELVNRELQSPWVALELVEGEALWCVLQREVLPWRRAVEIARDLADALAHAHARGILHRDVKPGNILVGRKWGDQDVAHGAPRNARSAFLTDFGLARLASTGSRLTRTGEALGTPHYMSPEQARGETRTLTPATDIWSVGAVLYEMLAGRPPFEADSPPEILEKVVRSEPIAIRRLRPDAPEGLDRVVRACLGKRPRARYRDATALRDDLDRVRIGEPPLARLPRSRLVVMPAALVLAAGAVVAVLSLRPLRPLTRADATPPRGSPAGTEAEALASRARDIRSSDPGRAEELLARALEAKPERDDWRVERGLLLWTLGRNLEARLAWERVPAPSPARPVARLFLGLESFFRLDREGTIRELEPLAGSGTREARLAGAAIAALAGRWEDARQGLRGEEGWEAALIRASVETSDPGGDDSLAAREYGRALDEGIQFSWAYSNLGLARQAQGDLAGAIRDYETALRINPRSAEAYANLGDARRAQGDLTAAIRDLSAALDLNPRLAQAYGNRGLVRQKQGDLAGAIRDFETVIELDPRDEKAYTHRGHARRLLGDLAGALRDYDAALEINPGLAEVYFDRGALRELQGDGTGAVRDFDTAIEKDPRHAQAYYGRGIVRQARGDVVGAIGDYDAAIAITPRFAEARTNRGILRKSQGDLAGAMLDFEAALEANPRLGEAYFSRGIARRELGDLAGAIADFERALEVSPPGWRHRGSTESHLAAARAAGR